MIYCEFLKFKHSKIKVIVLLGILVPSFLSLFSSIRIYANHPENKISLFTLYDSAFMFLMLLFGPLVFSIIASYLFSREYTEKTLKTIFVVPISRKKFISCKFLTLFICVVTLMLFFWASILILCTICNIIVGTDDFSLGIAVFFLVKIIIGSVLLYFTITPMAFLAYRTRGIITSMVAASVIALINVILTNAPVAGFFPWTASYLIINGRVGQTYCPVAGSLAIILLVFFISYKLCSSAFEKEDIN